MRREVSGEREDHNHLTSEEAQNCEEGAPSWRDEDDADEQQDTQGPTKTNNDAHFQRSRRQDKVGGEVCVQCR